MPLAVPAPPTPPQYLTSQASSIARDSTTSRLEQLKRRLDRLQRRRQHRCLYWYRQEHNPLGIPQSDKRLGSNFFTTVLLPQLTRPGMPVPLPSPAATLPPQGAPVPMTTSSRNGVTSVNSAGALTTTTSGTSALASYTGKTSFGGASDSPTRTSSVSNAGTVTITWNP